MSDALAIQQETSAKTIFGFWIYLMTDCVLFGSFFASYAVLCNNTFGGPSARELFSLPYALTQTLILLTSSFTCGLIMLAAQRDSKKEALIWFLVTFLLGAAFLGMELNEFRNFIQEGNSWTRSGFLTSFFSLVSLHGLHITSGLLWAIVLVGHILQRGFSASTIRRLACFSMFWHFLDIVWIFIFTFVYLMGAK